MPCALLRRTGAYWGSGPNNWVRPRIPVPDSTTPADRKEEQANVKVNEVADVDIETVTSSDSDGQEDGWLEQSTGTST